MQRLTQFVKYVVTVTSAVFLVGCVSTQTVPLDHSRATLSKPATLVITNRESPSFVANTAGKVQFGLFGAIAATKSGNNIIQQHNVKDPSEKISTELSQELNAKYGVTLLKSTDVVSSANTKEISASYPNADWILDIQTTTWNFWYFPSNWALYKVLYAAKARLIDGRDKKLIAESFCARIPKDKTNAPTKDILLANNAARLKKELAIAADYCINEFKSNMLNL